MPPTYDVFLSHNSVDELAVEEVAKSLQNEAGLRPFLDKWHLVPGEAWIPALEQAIEGSATVAVFFGPAGLSGWHDEEKQLALDLVHRARQEGRRVIPVLLPGGRKEDVKGFLKLRTWVDLAADDGFVRLVAGITGQAPELLARVQPGESLKQRLAELSLRSPDEDPAMHRLLSYVALTLSFGVALLFVVFSVVAFDDPDANVVTVGTTIACAASIIPLVTRRKLMWPIARRRFQLLTCMSLAAFGATEYKYGILSLHEYTVVCSDLYEGVTIDGVGFDKTHSCGARLTAWLPIAARPMAWCEPMDGSVSRTASDHEIEDDTILCWPTSLEPACCSGRDDVCGWSLDGHCDRCPWGEDPDCRAPITLRETGRSTIVEPWHELMTKDSGYVIRVAVPEGTRAYLFGEVHAQYEMGIRIIRGVDIVYDRSSTNGPFEYVMEQGVYYINPVFKICYPGPGGPPWAKLRRCSHEVVWEGFKAEPREMSMYRGGEDHGLVVFDFEDSPGHERIDADGADIRILMALVSNKQIDQ